MTGDELKRIVKQQGFKYTDVARSLGINKQTFDAKTSAKKLDSEFADKVLSIVGYTDADKATLPTTTAERTIRYWVDVDATAGGVTLFEDTMTANVIDIKIPEFGDCTDAVNLYGDSMYPLYRSGQIIILKRWTESFIDFGNVYLIITKNGNRMVKYIRKGSTSNRILCASENPAFDSFEIPLCDIQALYLVKGSIKKDTL